MPTLPVKEGKVMNPFKIINVEEELFISGKCVYNLFLISTQTQTIWCKSVIR